MDDPIDDSRALAEMLMTFGESIEPIVEFARGFKTSLLNDGWDSDVASQAAGMVLVKLLDVALRNV